MAEINENVMPPTWKIKGATMLQGELRSGLLVTIFSKSCYLFPDGSTCIESLMGMVNEYDNCRVKGGPSERCVELSTATSLFCPRTLI